MKQVWSDLPTSDNEASSSPSCSMTIQRSATDRPWILDMAVSEKFVVKPVGARGRAAFLPCLRREGRIVADPK
jgi:hypothetical protein